jgi:signal transduction histidine kinase
MDESGTHDRILILDDQPDEQTARLGDAMRLRGCAVTVAPTQDAIDTAQRELPLLGLLRVRTGGEALEARVRCLREGAPGLRVAVVGPRGDVPTAVAAVRAGALDYLETPAADAALDAVLRRVRAAPDPQDAARVETLQAILPGLVHELRNPLSGILAGSQMLSRILRGEGRAPEYAAIVQEEAQQLERFLSRLADLARLRTRPGRPDGRIELPETLARVLETAATTSRARLIQMACAFDPRADAICGDADRLAMACGELLRNAQEAMPDGGTLTVSTRRLPPSPGAGDSWIEIEVRDTGTGLSAEARRRAFEPFFSTRPRALGLGLSLAQAIVWALGGTIRLEPATGKGSRSVLRFPAVAADRAGSAPAASRATDGGGENRRP